MENILSKKEIEFITEDSKHERYQDPTIIHPSFVKTHIMRISHTQGLILFYGNEKTGFVHIQERHSLTSIKPFWDEVKKLQNPSKFNNSIVPIFDYLKIAEGIYKVENLNTERNNNCEIVDLYIGKITLYGIEQTYKLILYKNTKIVHTLYPTSSKFNLKRKTNKFSRANISISHDILENTKTILVPYKNIDSEVNYQIKFICDLTTNHQKTIIYKFKEGIVINKMILQSEKVNSNFSTMELLSYQYKNFSKYEKVFENL